MRLKNHSVIYIQGGQLQDAIKNGLVGAGYSLKGEPKLVNYHEVYAAITNSDGAVMGSAWKLTLDNNRLVLAGGIENELDSAASKELCRAGKDFINSLGESPDANKDWRNACVAASIASFARGRFVSVDPEKGRDITIDGTPLNDLVITDGQRGVAYDMDGRRLRYPRTFKSLCKVDVSSDRFCINSSTIPAPIDRKIAVGLMVADMARKSPGVKFDAYEMLSKNLQARFDHEMLLIKANGKAVGTISCPDAIEVSIQLMEQENIQNAHDKNVYRISREPEIVIDPAALDRALKEEATFSPEMS